MRGFIGAICVLALAGPLRAAPLPPGTFDGMRWRLVGPFRGGRTVTATGVPGHPDRFYFGAVGGGVWRTDNAGRTWTPIFDDQPIASIGAVAVAPSNADVLYVGSGEADMRSDISYGNGMYRSGDGGKTFTPIGLQGTRQIGRILVDPADPDLVYVAALGHAYGPNPERGVYRSKDGGKTWARVLFKDDDTGAIDLAFDPLNSRTILAALWQTRRPPWNVYPPSNGAGSGLYRSEDGGDTWTQVTRGLPSEKVGRMRVAFAPSEPARVYAIVDATAGGLYRSDDRGVTWSLVSSDKRIWDRGWYFAGVTVDPKNADVVYACDTAMYRSTDAGKTFVPFKGAPGGDDYHRLWIDPDDPRRMIVATDQGAVVSLDGGTTWSSWYNQPTGQFYHVATDDRFPYWIYGAQQDSGAAATPVRTDYRSITQRDWNPIAIGGESGYIVPDPEDPNVVWGGTVGRFDWRTLQEQNLDPTLAVPEEYRSEWTLPLTVSPRPPHALYFARQYLFRSTDGGGHWDRISPDLTREDPGTPSTLDPVSAANSEVKDKRRGVIYAIAPSSAEAGLLWCGTDDGLVWRTQDDGKNWSNVTPKDLAPWSKVGTIEASRFDARVAYASIDRHRLDDLHPLILRTRDGGASWTRIAAGIPEGAFVNVVREDPVRRGLLYAGTELGVFVSFDDGDSWQPLKMNLPPVSIRDIDVRHGDLVVGTHGRAFWVLDDLSPLRQVDAIVAAKDIALLRPRDAVRLRAAGFQGTPEPKDEPMAANPPLGATIDYVVAAGGSGPVRLEIVDGAGTTARTFSSDDPADPPANLAKLHVTADWSDRGSRVSAEPGLHRFVWDLRYTLPQEIADASPRGDDVGGPWAAPGRYRVRLSRAGKTVEQPLVLAKDPRVPEAIGDSDLAHQHALAADVVAQRLRVAKGMLEATALRKAIASAREKANGDAASALDALSHAVDEAAGPAYRPTDDYWTGRAAPATTLRRLTSSLEDFQSAVDGADLAPTRDARDGLTARMKQVNAGLALWGKVLSDDLARANDVLRREKLPPVHP